MVFAQNCFANYLAKKEEKRLIYISCQLFKRYNKTKTFKESSYNSQHVIKPITIKNKTSFNCEAFSTCCTELALAFSLISTAENLGPKLSVII